MTLNVIKWKSPKMKIPTNLSILTKQNRCQKALPRYKTSPRLSKKKHERLSSKTKRNGLYILSKIIKDLNDLPEICLKGVPLGN